MYAKQITLKRNTEGQVTDITETMVDHSANNQSLNFNGYRPFEELREVETKNGKVIKQGLFEAVLSDPDRANILRDDLRLVAFTAFNQMDRSFAGFTDFLPSDRPQEEYLRDAAIGVIPDAPSGHEAPLLKSSFEGGVTLVNTLRRGRVRIEMDDVRFDRIGKIRQIAQELGLAGRMTEENAVYAYITNTTNYGRNSTTSDNDVGANQQTLTWNADSLRTARAVISTSKDPKSGAYLGYNANTLICGPLLEVPALQLLTSAALSRVHGATTAEAIGTGAVNPLAGTIDNIIVTPWFDTSYGWALCDSRRNTFKFQTVEAFNVFQSTQIANSEVWRVLDAIEYLVKGYFGVGFSDDRAWFYSDSTTDATVS